MSLTWRPGFQFDVDASAYIEAVEAADEIASPGIGALETGVRYAINNFVIGCKQDGIWSAIKASCILAGARTLQGALVPLVGTAPTKYGTEGGWNYNRKTGLQGNGTDNYLDSNRANDADPQDDNHNAVWNTSGTGFAIGTGNNLAGRNFLNGFNTSIRSSTVTAWSGGFGFWGTSRSSSSAYARRRDSATQTVSTASQSPTAGQSVSVFAYSGGGGYSTNVIAFYSIGESLDLAALDGRVTDLMTAIGAAIP
jgi:hypothetical protein